MNLAQGIVEELKRNRELLEQYKAIPAGAFGARLIQERIDNAEKAQGTGDVIEMLTAYEELKSTE